MQENGGSEACRHIRLALPQGFVRSKQEAG